MSVNFGPDDWKERGFDSLEEYEQWLEDQDQLRYIDEWNATHNGGGGCGRLALFTLVLAVSLTTLLTGAML